jgi:hypothetical protein
VGVLQVVWSKRDQRLHDHHPPDGRVRAVQPLPVLFAEGVAALEAAQRRDGKDGRWSHQEAGIHWSQCEMRSGTTGSARSGSATRSNRAWTPIRTAFFWGAGYVNWRMDPIMAVATAAREARERHGSRRSGLAPSGNGRGPGGSQLHLDLGLTPASRFVT